MKIIFLNTWHGELAADLHNYIKKHINDTAIFCFHEAPDGDRGAYEELFTNDFVRHTVHRTGTGFGNTMYIRNTLPLTDYGTLFVDIATDLELGIAHYATLQLGDEELTICSIHGIPLPGHKLDTPARLYQSQTLIDTFAGKRVVIGGDFNLLPEAQSVKTFAEHGYQDLISDFAIQSTRNHHAFERYPDNPQYYADYTFVSPDIKVTDFVVPEEIVSDHQPLEVTIQ